MLIVIQAPIIMMLQHCRAKRDCIDAAYDYALNLKAKIEIILLYEKLYAFRFQEIIMLRDQDRS